MPPNRPVELWEREPHTGAKHELLRSYMGAWYGIMSTTQSTRFVYYDAFGGTVAASNRYRRVLYGWSLLLVVAVGGIMTAASMSQTSRSR